jgi:hypothetical protein
MKGKERAVFIIREVVRCKPGKVKPMLEKFRTLSTVLREMNLPPLRLLTDASGERFWTLVAEATVEKVDDFFALEHKLRTNDVLRKTMADYHDLIDSGRREIYRLES